MLAKWPTGGEVDLDEAVRYHKAMPAGKNLALLVQKARAAGETLIYPRGGVALLEDQGRLMLGLATEGTADFVPSTTDSYTRNESYERAEYGIEKTKSTGKSALNGFPIVNYGVGKCRGLVEALKVPAMVLPGTPMVPLIAEIGFAAGYTGLLGGGISDTIRFTKELTPAQGIRNYQYVDRLVAYYAEQGVPIHREQTGFLTGTLIPPGIAIAIGILDCLLAASQGVRHYSIGLGQNLNIVQDVAALRVLPEVCREYLHRFGYDDFFLGIGSHQWMGAFPRDAAEAMGIIGMGAAIAVLGNATHVCTKTSHEALGVPTLEANVAGLRTTRKVIGLMRRYRLPEGPEVSAEMAVIGREVRSVVDSVLAMGDGDPGKGAIRGLEAGILDIPWSPNVFVANKVMPARDYSGAIRYYDAGNLPLPQDIKDYHRRKLEERADREGRKVDITMALDDVSEIAKLLTAE